MALSDSLISAWELNESSGNAIDSHGSNTLTDNNTVGVGTGLIYGNARDFDPTADEGFSITDNADLSFGDEDFTLEAWVNPDVTSVSGQNNYFAGKGFNTEYMLYREAAQVVWFVNGTYRARSVTLTAGNWYQIIAWHDSVGNVTAFCINNDTPTSGAHSTGCVDGAAAFSIGRNSYEMDGRIGPVRLWNRVLASDERTELYNSGSGRTYAYISGGGTGQPAARRHAMSQSGLWLPTHRPVEIGREGCLVI